ncbi:unnamed protein product, partial [marine sediment metagenome]
RLIIFVQNVGAIALRTILLMDFVLNAKLIKF